MNNTATKAINAAPTTIVSIYYYFLSLMKYNPAKKQEITMLEPTVNTIHFWSKLSMNDDIRTAVATYLAISISHFLISFLIVSVISTAKMPIIFENTKYLRMYFSGDSHENENVFLFSSSQQNDLHIRIGTEEAAQIGVVHPAVHVYEAGARDVLVARVAAIELSFKERFANIMKKFSFFFVTFVLIQK